MAEHLAGIIEGLNDDVDSGDRDSKANRYQGRPAGLAPIITRSMTTAGRLPILCVYGGKMGKNYNIFDVVKNRIL
jgi:hypothetical protein